MQYRAYFQVVAAFHLPQRSRRSDLEKKAALKL